MQLHSDTEFAIVIIRIFYLIRIQVRLAVALREQDKLLQTNNQIEKKKKHISKMGESEMSGRKKSFAQLLLFIVSTRTNNNTLPSFSVCLSYLRPFFSCEIPTFSFCCFLMELFDLLFCFIFF